MSELKTERTNLVNELRHVDAALSVLGKLDGGSNSTETEAHSVSLGSQADEPRAESAMGKGERSAPKPKRTISAAGRKRIAAAQRARWAKLKAGKKKAA